MTHLSIITINPLKNIYHIEQITIRNISKKAFKITVKSYIIKVNLLKISVFFALSFLIEVEIPLLQFNNIQLIETQFRVLKSAFFAKNAFIFQFAFQIIQKLQILRLFYRISKHIKHISVSIISFFTNEHKILHTKVQFF